MITKQQVEGLIERLADKTLSFGCELLDTKTGKISKFSRVTNSGLAVVVGYATGAYSPVTFSNEFIILGHPITIGAVLEKIQNISKKEYCEHCDMCGTDGKTLKLLMLWQPLGFSRSLQDIISDSVWKDREACGAHRRPSDPCECMELKSHEATALCAFLLHLFPENDENK